MITSHSYKIFLYVALPCEAKPLITYFQLKKDLNIQPFAIFGRDDLCLIVTGLGKTAMAAAIAYTQALFSTANPVLVNIGVAGHKDLAIGTLCLANKIVDVDSERCFYPPLVFKTDIPSYSVFTKAIPQLNYDHLALCDMEASAFYETAMRFTSSELVQCLKVVSDNALQPADLIQAEQVSQLINKHCSVLAEFITQVTQLKIMLNQPELPLFDELSTQYHFTASAKAQLHSLLQRWSVLTDDQPLAIEGMTFKHSKDLLRWLEQQLYQACFSILHTQKIG